MQQGFKICPKCGLQAALNQQQCVHCLHVYKTDFSNKTVAMPSHSQRLIARRRFPWGWAVALVLAGIAIYGGVKVLTPTPAERLIGSWATVSGPLEVLTFFDEQHGMTVGESGVEHQFVWSTSSDIVYIEFPDDKMGYNFRYWIDGEILIINSMRYARQEEMPRRPAENILTPDQIDSQSRTAAPAASQPPAVSTATDIRSSRDILDKINIGMKGNTIVAILGPADKTSYFGPEGQLNRLLTYHTSDGPIYIKITYPNHVDSITTYNPLMSSYDPLIYPP
ncbi:MAG: hypothetical protein IH944_00080 [Armatimonadetes bacterium]|nr:hypothetical protein [Armatimonadota bacterium]